MAGAAGALRWRARWWWCAPAGGRAQVDLHLITGRIRAGAGRARRSASKLTQRPFADEAHVMLMSTLQFYS
jgi:hypothetical protein